MGQALRSLQQLQEAPVVSFLLDVDGDEDGLQSNDSSSPLMWNNEDGVSRTSVRMEINDL